MITDTITLTELIDTRTLQQIQDAFANATGMAALTVDLNGPVTHLSNPTEFCMKLTRGCPKGAERCNRCDLKGGEEAGRTGKPSVYYCHGGLMDFAAPILLGRRQIGSLLGGQVLPEPPDINKFRRIAKEIGLNEDEYIRALSKIRIVPKKNIEAAANLLYIMANSLSDMGYQRLSTRQLAGELIAVSAEMREKIGSASRDIGAIERQNRELVSQIEALTATTERSKNEVEKTDQIVSYSSTVSMQTKLLGFNASVEASKAGESGRGFNVIAQEIRRLAETSQTQSTQIVDIISSVKKTIHDMNKHMGDTYSAVTKNTEMLQDIAHTIEQINASAHKLEELGKQL